MARRLLSDEAKTPDMDDSSWNDVSENPLFLYDWFLPGVPPPRNLDDPEPALYNADTGVVYIRRYLANEDGYFVVVTNYNTGEQVVKAVLWPGGYQEQRAADQPLFVRFFEPDADIKGLDSAPTMTFTQKQIAGGRDVATARGMRGIFDALFVGPDGKVDDKALWSTGDIPTRGATLAGTQFTFWLASTREGFAKFFRFMMDGRICSDDPAQLQGAQLLDELACGRRFVFVTEDGDNPEDVSQVIAVIMFSRRMYTEDWEDYADVDIRPDDDMTVPVLYIDRICSNSDRAMSWEPGDARFGIALQYLMGLLAQQQGWRWMRLEDATDNIGTGDNYYRRLGWRTSVYEFLVFDVKKDLGRLYGAIYKSVSAQQQQQQRKRQASPTAAVTGKSDTSSATSGSGASAGGSSPEKAASPQRKRARIKPQSLSDSDDKETAAAAAMLIRSHGDVTVAARLFVKRFGF